MSLTHFSLRVVRNLVYSRSPTQSPSAPVRLRVVRNLGPRLKPRSSDAPIARAPHRAPDRPYSRGPRRPDIPTPITRVQDTGTGRLMRRLPLRSERVKTLRD